MNPIKLLAISYLNSIWNNVVVLLIPFVLFYSCSEDYEQLSEEVEDYEKSLASKEKKEAALGSAGQFTFVKIGQEYKLGKAISTEEIMVQIKGALYEGYRLKSIEVDNKRIAKVEGIKPNLKINVLKSGVFTATIVLENPNRLDVTINEAVFIIFPSFSKNFIFEKLAVNYTKTDTITSSQIMNQITGATSEGYRIKGVKITTNEEFAKVYSIKKNIGINLIKPGVFTATITLEKENFTDVIIRSAEFDVFIES